MSNINKRKVAWALWIIWMIAIFSFSQLPGNESEKQSDLVIYIFNVLGLDLNSRLGELSTFVVRKIAHFTEYFILYLLSYNVIKTYISKGRAKMFSILFVFAYACTDEIHQIFVPGRGPAFRDVMVDTTGGIFACLVSSIVSKLKKK